MVPILFSKTETDFTTNGLGRLTECSSCIVTEERNGIYECEFQYPITGKHYKTMIESGGIIGVIHDDRHDIQPFDIYRYSAPIDGVVTFNAHHISYRLANIVVKPFSGESCADSLQGLKNNAINNCPFTFWTDKTTDGTFNVTHPDNIRALLGGQEGSILDVYGKGDYEFDNFDVRLSVDRGNDSGVTIRYGKNLVDLDNTVDESTTFSAVAPYWTDGETTVTLPEGIVVGSNVPTSLAPWTDEGGTYITDNNGEIIYFQYPNIVPTQLDLSDQFEEQPTVAQLRQKAIAYLDNNEPWKPTQNISVDFVQLWQTPEYENVAALQRVSLCDTVGIFYPELGLTQTSAKVIRVDYNVLLERYDSMEVGEPRTTLAETVASAVEITIPDRYPTKSFLDAAIEEATEKITGGLGGHVVMTLNADGEPQEILIMDTDDINTAVNVIRMNQAGIGFSQNGYNGPFESAWTIDGKFNADFIATGTLLANYIHGGTLSLGGIDDGNGVIRVYGSDGHVIGSWTRSGLLTSLFQCDYDDGYIRMSNAGFEIYSDWLGSGLGYANTLSYSTYTNGGITVYGWYITQSVNGVQWSAMIAPGHISAIAEGGTYRLNFDRPSSSGAAAFSVRGLSSFVGNVTVSGSFSVTGTKNRLAEADEYGERLLYCYETPSPLFGDVGEAVLDETGLCYVFLDPVFAETIATNQYQVFLQRYGQGDCFVAERKPDYFVVQGEPGLAFGWELKAKQKDFDQMRLEKQESEIDFGPNYGEMGSEFFIQLEEGRIA